MTGEVAAATTGDPSWVSVLVSRQRPGRLIGPSAASVSPMLAARLGVAEGIGLAFRSRLGREAVASGVVDQAEPLEETVRLGSLLWRELGVRPGETVSVGAITEGMVAKEVVLTLPMKVPHKVEARIAESLKVASTPVLAGGLVHVDLTVGLEGTRYSGAITCQVVACSPSPSFLSDDTEVMFGELDHTLHSEVARYADIGGLKPELRRLWELIELPLRAPELYRSIGITPPKGVLLVGPPGTGKSLTARVLCSEVGLHIATVSGPELVRSYAGETEANLRDVFAHSAEHAPSLIVIDELDALVGQRDKSAGQSDVRIVSQLLELMDGLASLDGIVVLATTNRPWALDDALRRPGRFDEELTFGLPDVADRREILDIHTRKMPLTLGAQHHLDSMAASLVGFSGADIEHLSRMAGLAALRRVARRGWGPGAATSVAVDPVDLAVTEDDLEEARRQVTPSHLRSLRVAASRTAVRWEEIVGLHTQKDRLLLAVHRAIEKPGSEGILLYGAPGNGKSALAEAVAGEVGATLIQLDGANVFTQWLGESESAVRIIFDKAVDIIPSVLVIDHLDALAPTRSGTSGEQAHHRVLAALIAAVDGACQRGGIAVIGVTDRADLVDPSILRAGRLGTRIEVGPPGPARRRELLRTVGKQSLSAIPAMGDDDLLGRLVSKTKGWSVAEIIQRAPMVFDEAGVR